jgi:RNA polymerase sigma factor (TIGR02999 family)
MNEVTQILDSMEAGDAQAADRLLPLVYDELRRLAAAQMARENPGHTLDATALVHEAFLRLVGDQQFANRRHFFAAAAEAMRRILVDNARRKGRLRHGGGRTRLELADAPVPESGPDLLLLDEALERLRAESPQKAEVVQLRFFAGLTMPQAAEAMGVSLATAERWWTVARAWLFAELADDENAAVRISKKL